MTAAMNKQIRGYSLTPAYRAPAKNYNVTSDFKTQYKTNLKTVKDHSAEKEHNVLLSFLISIVSPLLVLFSVFGVTAAIMLPIGFFMGWL